MSDDDKIACYTPTKDRHSSTRIPRWKYACIRRAILDELDDAENGQVTFASLASCVTERLTSDQLAKLGSVKWHVTTVKLNMENEGEIERIPHLTPQRLRKLV